MPVQFALKLRHCRALCRSYRPRYVVTKAEIGNDAAVSTDWLHNHLQDVSVLDIRGHVDTVLIQSGVEQSTYISDYNSYLKGHIPGAAFVNWTKTGIDVNDPTPVQLEVDGDLFAAAMESKGVSTERPVVVYDEGDGMLAARLWWSLKCHGHPSPLVLEGGWRAWTQEGRPTELYEPCPLKLAGSAFFEPQPNMHLRATAEDVLQALEAPGDVLLLDVRSPEQYSGQVRRGPRGGRIPGARSLPRQLLAADGGLGWKSMQDQRAVLEAAGVKLDGSMDVDRFLEYWSVLDYWQSQEIILYCNGGVAACVVALALERQGIQRWRVYDGSWNEWSVRRELPIEAEMP